jgi:hypothetical protein
MGFFTAASFLGAPRWMWMIIGVLVAGALAFVAYTRLIDKQDDIAKDNQEVGAAVQREEDLQETIERVETGNETRNEVAAEAAAGRGPLLYRQCLSSNRGAPENCERFLPDRPADKR